MPFFKYTSVHVGAGSLFPWAKIGFFLMLLLLSSCDLLLKSKPGSGGAGTVVAGEASYYADKFHGRRTASGDVYDKNKLTAAHKTLAFGTQVEVKNLKNKKTVRVKINDRMPASSKRSIDLSRAAAQKIGMIRDGVVPVEIRILSTPQ